MRRDSVLGWCSSSTSCQLVYNALSLGDSDSIRGDGLRSRCACRCGGEAPNRAPQYIRHGSELPQWEIWCSEAMFEGRGRDEEVLGVSVGVVEKSCRWHHFAEEIRGRGARQREGATANDPHIPCPSAAQLPFIFLSLLLLLLFLCQLYPLSYSIMHFVTPILSTEMNTDVDSFWQVWTPVSRITWTPCHGRSL